MRRFLPAALLGTVVLVTTWVSAPASPAAPPVRVSVEDVAPIEAMAPLVAEVDQEVARLRAQLASVPEMPRPGRDPFSFGVRRPAPRVDAMSPATGPEVGPQVPAIPPSVLWPSLTAVMSNTSGQTAVLAWGDDLEFLQPGESFRGFFVVSVSSSAIELRHTPTGTSQTLKLR